MSIVWKPSGTLDLATAATDLPEVAGQGSTVSPALARCKNLRPDRKGLLSTRYGSVQVGSGTVSGTPSCMLEQDGARYVFTNAGIYRNETRLALAYGAEAWTAVAYNAYNDTTDQIYAANGTQLARVQGSSVYSWGITAPTAAPTLAATTGGLSGAYGAKYTYARLVSGVVVSESNPSPAGTAVTLAGQGLRITPTQPTDTQVTHILVYRTVTGGSTYYYDQAIAVGVVYADSTQVDTALGSEAAINHDPPPVGLQNLFGPVYNGTLFGSVANRLYWCSSKQPEYWPATQYIEVGARQLPILSIINYTGQVYALTATQLWYIQGLGGEIYNALPMQSSVGALSFLGAVGIEGVGIVHAHENGVYVFAANRDSKLTQGAFEPLFRGESVGGVPMVEDPAAAWVWQWENWLLYHYGHGSVLAINLDTQRAAYYDYGERLYAPCVDTLHNRLLAVDASGRIRWLEREGSVTDMGVTVSWEAQSKDFTLQTRAHFPRWAKYDVAGTATGSILLDDAVHQTHALTVDRDTRHRLIKTGNGKRCSIRLSGSGAATIYAVEME